MDRIREYMNNRFILLIASGLYPAVFLMGNNWHIYSNLDIFILFSLTLVLILAFSMTGFALLNVLVWMMSALIPRLKESGLKEGINKFYFSFFACTVFFFLMQTVNGVIIPNPLILWAIMSIIVIVIAIVSCKKGLWILNSFLCILLALSCLQWSYSYSRSLFRSYEVVWFTKNKAYNDKIVFNNHPNVYAICLESYNNEAVLNRIYNYRNDNIRDILDDNGFIVYDNFYSNYSNTLTSLVTMFTMEHHYYAISAGNNDAVGARQIIGAQRYNPVVSIFQNNGYKTQFLSHSDYCYFPGKCIEYAYPKRSMFRVFEIYRINQLNNLLSKIFPYFWGNDCSTNDKNRLYVNKVTAFQNMSERIRVASNGNSPYFTFIKLGQPGHFEESWDKINPLNGLYVGNIKKTNTLLTRLMKTIMENDPDPLIIFFGDHGAYRYRAIWEGDNNIHKNFTEHNVSATNVAYDLFGVFLAIRFPNQKDPQYDIRSTANLMRYIFSYLCECEIPLETKVDDESYFKYKEDIYITTRNGKPLDRWLTFK